MSAQVISALCDMSKTSLMQLGVYTVFFIVVRHPIYNTMHIDGGYKKKTKQVNSIVITCIYNCFH